MKKELDALNIPPKPKKPLTVYFQYRAEKLNELNASHPNSSFDDKQKIINEEYKKLTED